MRDHKFGVPKFIYIYENIPVSDSHGGKVRNMYSLDKHSSTTPPEFTLTHALNRPNARMLVGMSHLMRLTRFFYSVLAPVRSHAKYKANMT